MGNITYHSQPATRQDEWLFSKLQDQLQGYFVEVGAYDGLRHSNTLALENYLDWTGILVEPIPELFEQMKANRPDCQHSNHVISDFDGFGHQFATGDGNGRAFSGLTGRMSDEWYAEHKRRGSVMSSVNPISLANLLEKFKAPKVIDYLSLDVEGAEYTILEGFFKAHDRRSTYFQRWDYTIRYMTVEFRYDAVLLRKLEELLSDHYVLDEVRAFDACFIHRSIA
jgi:FkbM family methyltransferase